MTNNCELSRWLDLLTTGAGASPFSAAPVADQLRQPSGVIPVLPGLMRLRNRMVSCHVIPFTNASELTHGGVESGMPDQTIAATRTNV